MKSPKYPNSMSTSYIPLHTFTPFLFTSLPYGLTSCLCDCVTLIISNFINNESYNPAKC